VPVKLTPTLAIPSADVLTGWGANARINAERDTTPAFSAPVVLSGNFPITVVTGQEYYEGWDLAGTTAHYYRAWISTSTGANPSEYSDVLLGRGDTYASIDDVLGSHHEREPKNTRYLARIASLLESATDEITRAVGFPFFRRPLTGTETFYLTGEGGWRLHLHKTGDYIVQLGTVKAGTYDSTLVTIGGADFFASSYLPGEPFDHIDLSPAATSGLTSWPTDRWGLEFSLSARGWNAIPANIREGAVARVRQLAGLDPAPGGGPAGPEEMDGRVNILPRLPDVTWRAIDHYRRRYAGCYIRGG
jgi:hypothetical protein